MFVSGNMTPPNKKRVMLPETNFYFSWPFFGAGMKHLQYPQLIADHMQSILPA